MSADSHLKKPSTPLSKPTAATDSFQLYPVNPDKRGPDATPAAIAPEHLQLGAPISRTASTVVGPNLVHAQASKPKPQLTPPIQREIRFVQTEGLPHLRKRRVSAACITCRKRKTRCSGEKPVCNTCRQCKQECLGYRDRVKAAPVRHVSTQRTRHSTPPPSEPFNPSSSHEAQHEYDGQGSFRVSTSSRGSSESEIHANYCPTKAGAVDDSKVKLPIFGQSHSHAIMNNNMANRIPFFRYFGRTAIVPGYKKVMVELRQTKPLSRTTSTRPSASPTSRYESDDRPKMMTPAPHGVLEENEDFPAYDPTDETPVDPLIIHLVEVFFSSCGCSFPFLHPEKFIPDVKNKLVESILVDSVCAIGARFSEHPLFQKRSRTEAGTTYANRAKALVIDAFSHPNLSATQALLLMAYFEFGQSKDSGLWNFTGTAIRFALDLGINRLEGMRGERQRRRQDARLQAGFTPSDSEDEPNVFEDDLYDHECRDAPITFWAIYFLDRAISSGTGRTVTLRHDDIEIPMPPLEVRAVREGELQPCPFAALIRIMSLYGKAADTINSIQKGASASQTAIQQLTRLQYESAETYSSFPPKLAFSIQNFEYYVQMNQSSVFLLVHVWFQALIILLHGDISGVPELHSQSARQVSLMSAKTIVHILKYAADREKKSIIANPFNSQPIYIAAKVFLNSDPSPDFLRCYKLIEEIDQYWSGVHYILTVLDQMLKGVDDPLLYREEEEEQQPSHDQPKGWSASGFAGETNLDVTWIDTQLMEGNDGTDDFLALTQSEMVDVGAWGYDLGYVPELENWEMFG